MLVPPPKVEAKEGAFITPRGADISVERDGQFSLYWIKTVGPTPAVLQGKFTTEFEARRVIEQYLRDYWKGRK